MVGIVLISGSSGGIDMGAVNSITTGSSKQFAPEGIRVNAIMLGLIDTEIHSEAGANLLISGGRQAQIW